MTGAWRRGVWRPILAGLLLVFPAALSDEGGSSPGHTGLKISAVTALLPPRGKNGAGATFRVEAFGGCFQWSSDRPDLLKVEAPQPLKPVAEALECMERKALECMERGAVLDREFFGARTEEPEASCQPVAILRSMAEDVVGTEKVLVFARDPSAPTVELRLEVYLARVARVEVETRVRRINVDDVEAVTAKAYDSSGNVFSSLEGMEFKWQVSDHSILREPPLVDTVYSLSPERRALALAGRQTDTLLLYGVSTGHASVVTSLLGAQRGEVASPRVQLTVSERLVVLPSSARVPPVARLQLQLKVLRGGRPLQQLPAVPLPAKHFSWKWFPVEGGAEVLNVPGDSGAVLAQRLGRGSVVVHDSRIENNTASSLITVAQPAQLRLAAPAEWGNASLGDLEWEEVQQRLLSSQDAQQGGPSTWYFVKGRKYILRLEVLDSTGQVMYIPSNLRASLRCVADEGSQEPAPLLIIRQTQSSAVVLVSADILGAGVLSYGNVIVEADAIQKSRGLSTMEWPKLTLEQKFHVVGPLRLQAPFKGPLVLPFLHSYRLQVSGGSGVYHFQIVEQKPLRVCSVSADGVVEVAGFTGTAKLFVSDKADAANNLTLEVLVRRPGGLVLKPPQLQLELPSAAAAGAEAVKPANYTVLVLGRPEAVDGDPEGSAAWKALRFWNCSRLQRETGGSNGSLEAAGLLGALAVESSQSEVAGASAVVGESQAEGVCAEVLVLPHSAGRFTLSAAWSRGTLATASRGERLATSLDLEVYSPLDLESEAGRSHTATDAALVAPCSSLKLQFLRGPGAMWVPGRPHYSLTSALEGSSDMRVRRLTDRTFEVLCLRPTAGPTRLVAEIRNEPTDHEAYGDTVVARGNTWVWCAVPASSEIASAEPPSTAADSEALVSIPDNSTSTGLRQGQAHRFSARFRDSSGQLLVNASELQAKWSIDDNPKGQPWTVDGRGTVTVPASALDGTIVTLRLVTSLPTAHACAETHGLDSAQQAIVKEALDSLTAPLPDTLRLRATTDIVLRWPGYPSRHFAYAPSWAYSFEVTEGTGSSRLRVGDAMVAETIQHTELCATPIDNVSNCTRVAQPAQPADGATSWPVQPLVPGYTWLTFEDNGQLGASPKALNATFFPVSRVRLTLVGIGTSVNSTRVQPCLVGKGVAHELLVEVWDSEGHVLPPASWEPAGLRVKASSLDLEVVQGPQRQLGSFAALGRQPGAVEIQALVYSHPVAVIYSNTLYVHVFETFDIGPKDLVVLPGQTFEFTRHGGPAADAHGVANVSFTSSAPHVAMVHSSTGLLTALKPGRTNVSAKLVEVATGRTLAEAQAEVSVVLPDDVTIQLLQLGGPALQTQESPLRLIRGASHPLRLSAHLTSQGLPLSLPLLTAPLGTASTRRAHAAGCSFRWRAGDRSVSLAPTTSSGAVAVDITVAEADSAVADTSVDIAVEVTCEGLAKKSWEASVRAVVLQPLLLVAPVPSQSLLPSGPELQVSLGLPPLGRVPLTFNRPKEHLQIELVGTGETPAGTRLVAELLDNGTLVELQTGPDEGEALLIVQDPRSSGTVTRLVILVSVRRPHTLRLLPRPRRLPLGGSASCRLSLADSRGSPLALPPNFMVSQYISHPSVMTSELVLTRTGETYLRLTALQEGCVAAGVDAKSPAGHQPSEQPVAAETLAVCVARGALAGTSEPLLVQPGAHIHLPVEGVVLGADDSQVITFTLRVLCQTGTDSPSAEQLSRDVASVLGVERGVVRARASRWSGSSPATDRCDCAGALEVDLEIDGSRLPEGVGLRELADMLWSPPSSRPLGQALQRLDRSFGLRSPKGCGEARGTWSASDPNILSVAPSGEEAIAGRPGLAVATFDLEGASVSADVEVAPVAVLQLESATGGLLMDVTDKDGEMRRLVSNVVGLRPLVVPLRFFAPDPPSAGFGTSRSRELRWGPFVVQAINFSCAPTEPELSDFFDFQVWSLENVSDQANASDIPLSAHAVDQAQAACVLRPKASDARRWADRLPPRTVTLQASLSPNIAWPHGRTPSRATVSWPFVPQFVATDDTGNRLEAGDVCANVTPSDPLAALWIWTGGQPVEAFLEGRARANISLQVRGHPQYAAVPSAMRITVKWESPIESARREDIILVLESRTSKQVQRLRIRVSGDVSSRSPGQAGTGGFVGSFVLPALLLFVILTACSRCLAAAGRQRQAPPAPTPPTGGLFGQSQGLGASPFRRVDLR